MNFINNLGIYIMCFCICFSMNSSLECEENRPLKVLFITSQYPSIAQTPMFNQAASLIDQGVDLHIFAEKQLNQNVVHDVINKYDLNSRVTYNPPEDLNQYDVIHAQFGGLLHRHMEILSNYSGVLFCSLRGSDVTKDLPHYPEEIPIINNMVDLFLPVCNLLKDKLINLGVDPNKIQVLHSTINLDKFPYRKPVYPLDGKIKIISVCRLAEKKGIDDALNAIAIVKRVYPNIEYTIIGDGANKDELVEQAASLHLEDVVIFAGYKKQEEVAEALSKAHLFLLPSKTASNDGIEGIPNAIKEAMAVGLPVVSTIHAGIPELVEDGISGFLVPEGKSKQIAKKLLHLIKSPEIWEPMTIEGRKVIEREYDMKVVNHKLYLYYMQHTHKSLDTNQIKEE